MYEGNPNPNSVFNFPKAKAAVTKLVTENVKANGITASLTMKWSDERICDVLPAIKCAKCRSELACEGIMVLFDVIKQEVTFKAWEGHFKIV